MSSQPLKSLFWAAFLLTAAMFVVLGIEQVRYPGFLEIMEADSLQQIARIADGKSPYPMPDGEFIALAYTPFYHYVAAGVYRVSGDSFAGPRLVSLLAALGSGLLLFHMGKRETGHSHIGALAAALYFAGYRIMDSWLTCALPDSLFLLLLLGGYSFLLYGTRGWHEAAWLTLFTLAFWTKQHGAFFFGFAVVYALVFRSNAWPRWTFVVGMLFGGPTLYFLLGPLLGDGFLQQTFVVPGHWERSVSHSVRRTAFVLVEFLPFALLASAIYLRTAVRLRPLRISGPAWMLATSLCATLATMTVEGSSNNHFIPFIAASFLCCALGINELLSVAATTQLRRMLGYGFAAALVLTSVVTFTAIRRFPHHPIPVFVPGVAVAALAGFAVLCFRQIQVEKKSHESQQPQFGGSIWKTSGFAFVLVLAQFGTQYFQWTQQVADPRFDAGLERLQADFSKLGGNVVWLPYGYVPVKLAGVPILKFPSTVALEDIVRQEHVPGTTADRLAPFFERVRSVDRLYVLSDQRIETTVVWNQIPAHWILVKDYGLELSGVQQITRHWFGGGSYPRYLYRMETRRPTADASISRTE
jgi:hypothetical protein